MIKPNELRLGNYVKYPFHELQVCQLFLDSFQGMYVGGRGCYMYESCDGIPLTAEWLLKFGFTQSSCHDSRNIFDRVPLYENNGVAIMLSDSEFWYVTRQYDGGSSDPFERVLEVKSVHQLQNLYYAITGEELTIQE